MDFSREKNDDDNYYDDVEFQHRVYKLVSEYLPTYQVTLSFGILYVNKKQRTFRFDLAKICPITKTYGGIDSAVEISSTICDCVDNDWTLKIRKRL